MTLFNEKTENALIDEDVTYTVSDNCVTFKKGETTITVGKNASIKELEEFLETYDPAKEALQYVERNKSADLFEVWNTLKNRKYDIETIHYCLCII